MATQYSFYVACIPYQSLSQHMQISDINCWYPVALPKARRVVNWNCLKYFVINELQNRATIWFLTHSAAEKFALITIFIRTICD